ncbi:MAG: Snf7 [Candidatus Bathyarchaeota archaeon BA2]|nr:MAG: Snf7 [Candidatus Bathyarchaeota archaeon BA2]
MIFEALPKLKIQRFKLEQVIVRLRERDTTLFKTCAKVLEDKNKERAIIFANELAEIRKLTKIIVQTQILVEHIILRLETLRELNAAFADLKPVLRILHSVTERLTILMPQMAYEMERVNESIDETLAMTHISSPQLDMPFDVKTPGGEEVLKEVSTLLEQKLAEKLPEPPTSVAVKEKPQRVEKVKQMVALAATCSEIREEEGPQTYVSHKDMELQSVSLKIRESSPLEDTVLEYAKKSGGQIDVTQCAFELNVSPEEVEKALEKLGAQGKIMIDSDPP